MVLAGGALSGCSGGSGGTAAPSTTAPGSAAPTSAPATSAAPTPTTGSTTRPTSGPALIPVRKGSPPIPWDTRSSTNSAPRPSSVPSRASGAAALTILLDDGTGQRSTWTLRCSPAGGTHPTPAQACGVLGANGAKAFVPTPAGKQCPQIYSGPQKALVRGTWRGKAVKAQFDLENGCEANRWSLLLGLLPPGGLA